MTIPLTRGLVATIDDEDFPLVSQHNWYAHRAKNGRWYARSNKKPMIFMHRLILNASSSVQVDHVDNDGLNNRRSNLRTATQSQNNANIGPKRLRKTKGTYLDKRCGSWRAEITVNSCHYYLGSYKTESEAAIAYDRAARKYFGEYARLNFAEAT